MTSPSIVLWLDRISIRLPWRADLVDEAAPALGVDRRQTVEHDADDVARRARWRHRQFGKELGAEQEDGIGREQGAIGRRAEVHQGAHGRLVATDHVVGSRDDAAAGRSRRVSGVASKLRLTIATRLCCSSAASISTQTGRRCRRGVDLAAGVPDDVVGGEQCAEVVSDPAARSSRARSRVPIGVVRGADRERSRCRAWCSAPWRSRPVRAALAERTRDGSWAGRRADPSASGARPPIASRS